MKLQISYDFTDLSTALEVAKKTAPFANILEIGTPLLYAHGLDAIKEFKKEFPNKKIFADTKLVDRVGEIIPLVSSAGADYISVLAGTSNKVIQKVTSIAHHHNLKTVLDLIDTITPNQSARNAKDLDIDVLFFHPPYDDGDKTVETLDEWENIRGNTTLPIFVSGKINKETIEKVLILKPDGIIIGEAITKASDPAEAAKFFREKF
jgi:3-hexulose-6-phosphate synthase